MTYLRIRIDIKAKDYENINEQLTFLVPTGEQSEWIFERIEQCRDQVLLEGDWRRLNMNVRLQCRLMTEEELQVDRINRRFGAKIFIPNIVDVSVQDDLYKKVIYPLNRLADAVEHNINEARLEDRL